MEFDGSVDIRRRLAGLFGSQKLHRPLQTRRYDPGTILNYHVKGVVPPRTGWVKLSVEAFVGGGYAGQVYRVRVLDVDSPEGSIPGLETGRLLALKLLVPATAFGRFFRNFIYALGFQGAFSLQVNPDAARAGALWQKLIRRGARIRFGTEKAVVDILATLVDPVMGSCGELSEWVDGRMWRFEVDDNLFARLRWEVGRDGRDLGSPEYRMKKEFMARMVRLMHDMGAEELARQYEWWTMKSQPNALKRLESDPASEEGLVAVDFRPGLVLLPFFPQCPADFKLIIKGFARGSFVQFDRGDLQKLRDFAARHPEEFSDMGEALEELEEKERSYRDSLPDITHHPIRLLGDRRLRTSIREARIRSWETRNMVDEKTAESLKRNRLLALVFFLLGALPLFGPFIRKIWGREDIRRHFIRKMTSWDYFKRACRARAAEVLIRWHRVGRVSDQRALRLARRPGLAFLHFPLSLLSSGLHRFLTDWEFTKRRLDYLFARPLRLYFRTEEREKWLRDMIVRGEKNGMLTGEEASRIRSQIKEPFIQKYLKSLAVHVCTLPVTQAVAVLVAFVYVRLHPELGWQEASIHAGIILGLFQVIPISPGSFIRGLYTTGLVLRERNFKDYNIAFFLSFFKYVGYLAFPLQMAYSYPDIARFMAAHWATGAVHMIPVFGERGALLEHVVFDLFYNFPLSLRRRIRRRDENLLLKKPRPWVLPLFVTTGTVVLTLLDFVFWEWKGNSPSLGDTWWAVVPLVFLFSVAVSAWGRRRPVSKRISESALSGALLGLFYAAAASALGHLLGQSAGSPCLAFLEPLAVRAVWQVFLFTLLAVTGALLAELRSPDALKK